MSDESDMSDRQYILSAATAFGFRLRFGSIGYSYCSPGIKLAKR
jgi:hypothetical protein